jgi:hypothetical protein
MIQIKNSTIIIVIAVALVLCFGGGYLLGRHDRSSTSTTIINGLNDIISTYSYQVNGLEKRVAEKETLIMSQRQALAEGLLVKEELRKLKIKHATDVVNFKSTIEILLDSIKHTGTVVISPCPPDEDHPVLYLPLVFGEQNDYLHLRGEFDEQGKLSMDIKIPLSVDVFTGYDKTIKKYKTTVGTDNPYVQFNDIRSVQLDLRKPRRFGVGVIGGYGLGLGTPKLTPIIGVGLSYSLIQF